jgi:Protein of unknown function (DUF2924)
MVRSRAPDLDIDTLDQCSRAELRLYWKTLLGEAPPACLGRDVLALGIAYAIQERRHGSLTKAVSKELDRLLAQALGDAASGTPSRPTPSLPRTGTVLVREWQGTTHQVTVVRDGFLWNGQTYRSLSGIARAITGAKWNGPRFFGMRPVSVGKTLEARHGIA